MSNSSCTCSESPVFEITFYPNHVQILIFVAAVAKKSLVPASVLLLPPKACCAYLPAVSFSHRRKLSEANFHSYMHMFFYCQLDEDREQQTRVIL